MQRMTYVRMQTCCDYLLLMLTRRKDGPRFTMPVVEATLRSSSVGAVSPAPCVPVVGMVVVRVVALIVSRRGTVVLTFRAAIPVWRVLESDDDVR